MEKNGQILYEDKDLKVTTMPQDPESHELWILGSENRYLLQRGILKDLGTAPRGKMERMLANVNIDIAYDAEKQGLTYDSLGVAFSQAYAETMDEEIRRLTSIQNLTSL